MVQHDTQAKAKGMAETFTTRLSFNSDYCCRNNLLIPSHDY